MNIERQMEINSDRREAANNRYYDMLCAKEDACDALIGELQDEKGKRYYINQLSLKGSYTGKIVEFANKAEATLFLIRNHYV